VSVSVGQLLDAIQPGQVDWDPVTSSEMRAQKQQSVFNRKRFMHIQAIISMTHFRLNLG